MMTINMSSILDKAKNVMNSDKMQKEIEQIVDNRMIHGGAVNNSKHVTIHGTNLAAAKFIEVLCNEINSHAVAEGGRGLSGRGLGSTAISALTKLEHGSPYKVGKNRYQIQVWFSGDLSRDSLDPSYFDGVDNIAALLNKGYSAKHTIYGTWPGHGYADVFNIPSLREREGLHFIENAIRDYMANYASEYGVIDIEVDDIYK